MVAGPNGSGKSTLYDKVDLQDFGRSVWIINPDILALRIAGYENVAPNAANLSAVKRIYVWLKTSIDAYQTIGVETVLSTAKYRRLIKAAKQRQFEFRLIYVLLDSVDRNIARVRKRVRMGGHTVPEEKIRERYVRSLKQLPWFLSQADRAFIFDNSTDKPRYIAQKVNGTIEVDSTALPVIKKAAEAAARLE